MAVETTSLGWIRGGEQPLRGRSRVQVRGWEELALESRDDFAAGLTAGDLTPEDIESALAVRDASDAMISDAIGSFWATHRLRYIVTPPR